jgi:hypothetical protein
MVPNLLAAIGPPALSAPGMFVESSSNGIYAGARPDVP